MLLSLPGFFRKPWRGRSARIVGARAPSPALQPLGVDDFLNLQVPARDWLLHPIIPERSLAMLYAPRGAGKSLLSVSIGLAVSSGSPLLRWTAPEPRRVLYVDGEMPLASLQGRIRAIAAGLNVSPSNDYFRVLAADNCEGGIEIGTAEGQAALDPSLSGIDLLILDNLSTLCTRSESGSDAWTTIQGWLLALRRRGVSVLIVHHAGVNGRQRGTSKREDALDTVIALRRPGDHKPQQGARFEVHYEKLRNRVEGEEAAPFEAAVENQNDRIIWLARDLAAPLLQRAAELFSEGLSVRSVATALNVSKSEAGRLRKEAIQEELFVPAVDEQQNEVAA